MKKINVLLVLVMVVFVATLAGCKKTSAVVDKPVASETVSSEEVSEEVSEEPSEETKEVEEVNFSNANELLEYVTNSGETVIVEFDFSKDSNSQFVIPNGTNYTMQLKNTLFVFPSKEATDIEANVEGITVMPSVKANSWGITIETAGTDIEVSATIKYADGTEEDILLYVTNTFE